MALPRVPPRGLLWRLTHAALLRGTPTGFAKSYLALSDLFLSLANLQITRQHGGVHPKHEIMRYEQFFLRFIEPAMTVLDVGSSRGTVTVKLADKARHVTGIEIDQGFYDFAQANSTRPNVDYILGDVTTFKPAQRYDVAVLSNVLEHIDDRVRLVAKIRDIATVLLVRVPALDRDWWPAYRRRIGIEWRSDTTHFIEHTEEELRAELAAAGWRVDLLERRWGEFYVKCSHAA
jgi:SAM-dependent methyltransferase